MGALSGMANLCSSQALRQVTKVRMWMNGQMRNRTRTSALPGGGVSSKCVGERKL